MHLGKDCNMHYSYAVLYTGIGFPQSLSAGEGWKRAHKARRKTLQSGSGAKEHPEHVDVHS